MSSGPNDFLSSLLELHEKLEKAKADFSAERDQVSIIPYETCPRMHSKNLGANDKMDFCLFEIHNSHGKNKKGLFLRMPSFSIESATWFGLWKKLIRCY